MGSRPNATYVATLRAFLGADMCLASGLALRARVPTASRLAVRLDALLRFTGPGWAVPAERIEA